MILQLTKLIHSKYFIEQLIPLWKEYADGFIFYDELLNDELYNYLVQNKEKFNILDIIRPSTSQKTILDNIDHILFKSGLKYTNNILVLDSNEYIDGNISKDELNEIFKKNNNSKIYIKSLQYTSCNTIRTNIPWRDTFKIKAIIFNEESSINIIDNFDKAIIDPEKLFIVNLACLDKHRAAIDTYYKKIQNWLLNKNGQNTVPLSDYDTVMSNFIWEEEYVLYPLKLKSDFEIYDNILLTQKQSFILDNIIKYNIPNLNNWEIDIFKKLECPSNIIYKISVITAIGNLNIYEKFIDRYFENIMQQHLFFDTEHIIIYSEWSKKFDNYINYKNIIFIHETESHGVYNAWNIGIKKSSTNYITNWNIDDIRHPINTKMKYDLLEKNPIYGVVYNYYVATHNMDENFYNLDVEHTPYLKFPDEYEKYVMKDCLIGPDPMWRKSLHDSIGYFDYETFPSIGDWEMWIRFSKHGVRFKLIPEVLCIYMDHVDTVSNTNYKNNNLNKQKTILYKKYSI